jgi:hypothetical protein
VIIIKEKEMEKLWDLGGLIPDFAKEEMEKKVLAYIAKDPINIARVQKMAYDYCKNNEKLIVAIMKGGA